MRMWLIAVLIAVFGVLGSVGFPHIVPRQACWSMRPSHRGSPQTGTAPFRIVAPANYRPGQEIEVTLNATGSRPFKGFLLEARTTRGVSDTAGTFRAINAGTQVNCDNEALCHNSAQRKTLIKGMWRAPATSVGPIVFKKESKDQQRQRRDVGMWQSETVVLQGHDGLKNGEDVQGATFVENLDTAWVGVTSAQVLPST